ncbi:MAG: acyloxyacyl hydrolase [Phycisphaeraceae bacterium]
MRSMMPLITAVLTGFFATAAGAAPPAAEPGPNPFARGERTAQVYFTGTPMEDEQTQYDLQAGAGYFFEDDWSINLTGLVGWVDPERDDDSAVVGLDLLFRYHFFRCGRISLYADGGAGFQYAGTDFPSDSHHNFRPQVGVGATLRLNDDAWLMGGARYLHISNANTSEVNDGFDAAMPYVGLMWSF